MAVSFASLPSALRTPAVGNVFSSSCQRSFHASPQSRASILFALGALSNSRETQHFNKLSRLPRTEHSPPLKLIETGEIKPFPLPTPSKPAPRSSAWQSGGSRSALRVWDERALQIGRVFLSDQARQTHRLRRALERVKRKQAKQQALERRDKLAWQQERQKLLKDMRAAGVLILASIGTATALATWRFWPGTQPRDSGDLGRKIAARAAAAMPLPASVSREQIALSPPPPVPVVVVTPQVNVPLVNPVPTPASAHDGSRWWKSLFWKQH